VRVCIEVHKLFQLNLDLFELLLSPCRIIEHGF
jgi:hypothetical protein